MWYNNDVAADVGSVKNEITKGVLRMKEKVYVYIGRFQITHNGHEEVLKHAIKNADL